MGFEVDFGYGDTMTPSIVSNDHGKLRRVYRERFRFLQASERRGFEIDFELKFPPLTYGGSGSDRELRELELLSLAAVHPGDPVRPFRSAHLLAHEGQALDRRLPAGERRGTTWWTTTPASLRSAPTPPRTYRKFSWIVDWYGGPENPATNRGYRELIDTTLTVTATPIISFYVNYDYAWQRVQ